MDMQKEYLKLKAELDKEYEGRLKALKEFFKVSGNEVSFSKSPLKRGGVKELVSEAVDKLEGDFSVYDVEREVKKLASHFNKARSAISTVLKRLEGKRVVRVSTGTGPNPTIYRKE